MKSAAKTVKIETSAGSLRAEISGYWMLDAGLWMRRFPLSAQIECPLGESGFQNRLGGVIGQGSVPM
jgi:hypothetical protein